jgi:hypothetical protein
LIPLRIDEKVLAQSAMASPAEDAPVGMGRLNRERLLPLLVFVLIQGVLLVDVTLHDPRIGYDAHEHARYSAMLAQGRLPNPSDTREFFSPPLPYVVPALAEARGFASEWAAGKIAQFANLLYSIGLCVFVWKICSLLSPGSYYLKFWSLALLAIIPAYYKSFSMVRGEPLLSLFAVASVYYTLRVYGSARRWRWDFILLGVLLGLAILCRQWGFFIFPALAIYALTLPAPTFSARMLNLRPLVLSFAIAGAVGGWYYASLYQRFGKVTAFNRSAHGWSIANEPAHFYYGLGLDSLFTDPIRPAFENELIPSFYSEFWGDYECYFLVYGKAGESGKYLSGLELVDVLDRVQLSEWFVSNRFTIGAWLGRAQAAALVPSALFVAGFLMAMATLFDRRIGARAYGLLGLVILISMLGYLWFLIGFPARDGDTIKATYMLQIMPLLAIAGARLLIEIRDRRRNFYRVIVGFLALSAALNAPFLITRYVVFPW